MLPCSFAQSFAHWPACGGDGGGGVGAIGGDSGGGGGGGEPSSIHAFQINFRPHVRERLKKRSHRKI